MSDDSDSSGTLSSAGGDDSNDDDDGLDHANAFQRDSILGGKLQQNRRLSTASSNFYSHYSENGWMNDGIGIVMDGVDDNKSIDSDEDGIEFDIEQLIETEHEKLLLFQESLNQCNKLSSKMSGVLQNLQDKLKKLQTTLDPIRKDTTEVALAEKNINKTMAELRKVMEYHQLTTEPLHEIKKKTLKASSDLNQKKENVFDSDEWNDPFLIWIEKINEARNYFEENKFKSSQKAINNLQNIAKIALDRMESYFRDLLKQHTTRNKRVIDQIQSYKLMEHWKDRNPSFPLWTNKLLNRKKKGNNNNNDDLNITDLLYIPYRVIKLLANVASRIEQTASVHNLPDNLGKLVISPRSNLLLDILKSLNHENLLTIMYIHAYYQNAMKNKTTKLFNKKGPIKDIKKSEEESNELNKVRGSMSLHDDDNEDDNDENDEEKKDKEEKEEEDEEEDENEEEEEEKKSHKPAFGVLSADNLEQLNTYYRHQNAFDNDGDLDIIAIAIDIKSQSHPIILFLHIALSLFQLERHLCSTILDVKNEVLLEFDEFFNEVIFHPLQLIIENVENVLKVRDIMDVQRNEQKNNKKDGRRVSFNQLSNLTNPNIPIEEAAKQTARSTAKAAIINDSIHKNMVTVKLDLVSCWMRLYPAFDRVLNQSQDYGANLNDDDDESLISEEVMITNNNNINGANNNNTDNILNVHSKRGMIHLSKLGDKLYLNCYDTLEARILMIKNHKEMKSVRIDGGYHPLTIETVKLMFGIYEFRDALQHLYDTQKSISPMMKILVNNNVNNKDIMKKRQIEKTLVSIVSALRHNLKNIKAAQYGNNKKTLESIFMLNNFHYIVKTMGDTELEIACGHAVLASLRKDIIKWKNQYEKATWEKIKDYININKLRNDYFTDKANNLSTKEKKPIKTRYAGFNKEFQEQLNTQKYFSVPDPSLRRELIDKNIDIVLPMYRIFVGKFKNIQFTKDRGKYHKYDEKTLHEKMHQFFQQN